MRYEVSAFSDRGRIREQNEDNFYLNNHVLKEKHSSMKSAYKTELRSSGEGIICFGLFDGMGGEAYGEKASLVAARTCGFYDKKASRVFFGDSRNISQEEILNFLNRMAFDANREILLTADKLKCPSHMGTTAVILLLYRDFIYCCSLGDSRIYFLKDGRIRQISEDQTDAALLRQLGITGRKPSLTQYLGIPEDTASLTPDIRIFRSEDLDAFLLASDGLTDMLKDSEIAYYMRTEDTSAMAETLVRAAYAAGGKDNITVIAGRVLR